MSKEEPVERRRHERFKVEKIAFAVLRNRVSKLGQIIDISRGGLAFHYIANQEWPEVSSELDILLASNNGFCLERLKFKTISDFKIANKSPYSSITVRRRGVQFEALTEHQTSHLLDFLRKHTVRDL
jgi:hypothetical protein